jgi:Ca-activated chloride channel family protein
MIKLFLVIITLGSALLGRAQPASQAILKGNEFYRQGKFEEAVKQYDAALKSDPGNATAKFNLASATYRLNKESDAIKAYDEIISSDKDPERKAKTYYNKGSILTKQNKLEESVELYKNALRIDPSDMQARENLQKALLELKKKEPPKKKEEDKKKKQDKQQQQQQKQKQQPKLNQKEAEQRLKLLEQKEKEVQQRLQKQKVSGGGSQNKDW